MEELPASQARTTLQGYRCPSLEAQVADLADPDKLGETAAKRIGTEGLHRTVCDYIAGMTDRYLMEEHARIGAL